MISPEKKRQIITLLIFIGALMVLLAISLPSLDLEAGSSFISETAGQTRNLFQSDSGARSFLYRLLQQFLVILLIVTALYIVVSLFDKDGRKQLIKLLIPAVLLILLSLWLSESPTEQTVERIETHQPAVQATAEIEPAAAEAAAAFNPEPSPWLVPFMIVGLALLLSITAYLAFSSFRNRAAQPQLLYDELAVRAQQAIDEIQEAKISFNEVIFRCYYEMHQVVKKKYGLVRAHDMTPNEFGNVLMKKGFPPQPVVQLTNLFEQARYGQQQEWDQARQIAVSSLAEVIDFCQGSL